MMDAANDPSLETLSAFVDGEEVPPEALAAALALPEAREVLRDYYRLRAALREDARPSPVFYARMERVLTEPWWRRKVLVPLPAIAAALLLVVMLAGAWVGWQSRRSEGPPHVSRLVPFKAGVDWHTVEGGSR